MACRYNWRLFRERLFFVIYLHRSQAHEKYQRSKSIISTNRPPSSQDVMKNLPTPARNVLSAMKIEGKPA